MRKTRVGKRIYVRSATVGTTWFCPYCCATVDTQLEAGGTAAPPVSLGQPGVRDSVLRPQGATETTLPMLEVRRLVRRAPLVRPDELAALAAAKGRIGLAPPPGFVSQVQRFVYADDLSIKLTGCSFRHRCLLRKHPLPPPNVSCHRGVLIGPVA